MASGWALAATVVLVTLARAPEVATGRLWAEEGQTFARDLMGGGVWDALTYVYRSSTLVMTSVPVWLAFQGPVDFAPLLLVWFAVGVQIVFALFYGMWARSTGIVPAVTLLGLVALLAHPINYEISASTTNVQWVAALGLFVLAITDGDTLRRRIVPLCLWAVLCGMTGVPSSMLAPVFLARALVSRSRPHLAIGVILSCTALVQLTTIVRYPLEDRALVVQPFLMLFGFADHTVGMALLGPRAHRVADLVLAGGTTGALAGTASIVVAAAVLAMLVRAARGAGIAPALLWIVAATALGVTFLNLFAAVGPLRQQIRPPDGGRYFAVAVYAVILLVVAVTRSPDRIARRVALLALVYMVLMDGAYAAVSQIRGNYSGPSWRAQIARCRARPERPCRVEVWPHTPNLHWQLVIPPARLGPEHGGPAAATRRGAAS